MMLFNSKLPIHEILNGLFDTYQKRVPDVKKITEAMISAKIIDGQKDIVNDHVAFRTMGVPHLGIDSLEKIFLYHGYKKMDFLTFETKKLNAYWYAPPFPELPRVFISELKVNLLSTDSQRCIFKYTDQVKEDPVEKLNLDNVEEVVRFFHSPKWSLPTLVDYEQLLNESEYAAWVIYNRYYLNHYTISVHNLPKGFHELVNFNQFLIRTGIKLNDAGGVIKKSADGLLLQSSSVAQTVLAHFSDGKQKQISGSYVEFAERRVLPQFAHLSKKDLKQKHRREGFETGNADKIFESTYTSQTSK